MKRYFAIGVAVGLILLGATGVYFVLPRDYNPVLSDWQARATKLIVEEKGLIGNRFGTTRVFELTRRDEIDTLMGLIVVKPVSKLLPSACACRGNPHLLLYDRDHLVATITVHHASSIRDWQLHPGNLDIQDENIPLLVEYFATLGLKEYVQQKEKGSNTRVERTPPAR